MDFDFAELDYQATPIGELSLRRRRDPALGGREVFEVKLGDDFLMSSLFTEGEVALAELGLDALAGAEADVVVGGLGLGYTAAAALEHPATRSLRVIEALDAVIVWHRRGLVPLGTRLADDPRCTLAQGDFFRLAASPAGLDPAAPSRRFHAVLVDIDHSPRHVLHPDHAPFYEPAGLRRLAAFVHPGGVFALWSNDPPDARFEAVLAAAFAGARSHLVTFANPYTGSESANTIYVARNAG